MILFLHAHENQNVEMLARWLNGKFYISNYCPVPIQEFLVFDGAIYPASTASRFYKTTMQLNTQTELEAHKPNACRLIEPSEHPELKNSVINAVVSLAVDTARAGYGALVFCSSRKGCETDARLISYAMPALQDISTHVFEKRSDLLCELRSTASGLDSTLEQTIPFGVGFHR
jgi:DNA polymerase theta